MPQCVFGKTGRAIAQPIADQVFVDDCLEGPDALLTTSRCYEIRPRVRAVAASPRPLPLSLN